MDSIEADFVVVGAGSAGCVVAARLAENTNASVVLLEAGGDYRSIPYDLPVLAGRLFTRRANNWYYHSEPQPHANGRRIFLPRGRMIGGSFIFNGAQYIRGNRYDYDRWSELGCPGWSYDEVLPYFRRTENFDRPDQRLHGDGGPLPVRRLAHPNVLSEAFIAAAGESGQRVNTDFNGAQQEGFGLYDFNVADGRRWTTARALLDSARTRPNLTVKTHATASRIVMADGRAVAVECRVGKKPLRVVARREIVLCAGAMNTPKLLQLSGIGDPAHLAPLGIEVVRALPGVGRNYQDHFNVALEYRCEKPVSLASVFRADRLALELLRAVITRRGPVTQSALEAGGFFYSQPGLPAPDCQAVFIPIAGSRARVRMPWQSAKGWHSFAVALWPNRPASRGSVMIRSSSPDDDPVIQPNFLSAEQDLVTTRAAVRIVRQILTAPALRQYRGAELLPGDGVQSDDGIDAFIRAYGKSGHHASGTAKMGTDPMAVVDPQLRVHGIAGLRIADASVIPTIVTGNTNAAVIMIAEVASELISRSAAAASAPAATPVQARRRQ